MERNKSQSERNKSQKHRSYVFTVNNWTEEDLAKARSVLMDSKYGIIGKEVGEQGTPHLQGYVSFNNPRGFESVRKSLGGRAHIKVAKGSAYENFIYCSKDKDFEEFGTRPEENSSGQGKRTDISTIKTMVYEGCSMKDICVVATSLQSIRMAEIMLRYTEKQRNWLPNVKWYWGESGVGKTRWAFEQFDYNCWCSAKDLRWWDGYDGHENVIFDEFRTETCSFAELLKILDRYPYKVEVKGGSRQLLAKNIIITSCYPPQEIYFTEENLWQLERRISEIIHFEKGTYDELRLQGASTLSLRVCLEQNTGTEVGGVILDPPPLMPAALEVAPSALECGAQAPPVKRKRGRPKKNRGN